MSGFILTCMFLTCFVGVTYQDKVPVLIWSNDRSLALPHPLAGHTISRDSFIHQYLNVLGTDSALNIVLFIQDKLNLKDITQNAAVFDTDDEENDALKHIKEIMSSMSVAQLPSVDSPLSAVAELKSHFSAGSIHELRPPYAVENSAVNQSSHNLLIVRLPQLQMAESMYQKYLQNIDDIVGSVTSQMKNLKTPFVAVYTAGASSDKEMSNKWSSVVSKRSGRQLLQTTASPFTDSGLIGNVSGMFMLYASNITLSYGGMERYQLNTNNPSDWTPDSSLCSNSSSNCTVSLTYNNGTTDDVSDDVQLTISAVQTSGSNQGYWYVSSIKVNSTTMDAVYFNPLFMELTPVGFSYHCYPNTTIKQLVNTTSSGSTSTTTTYWTMSFFNIQIQVFGPFTQGGFGYYNDCTCFFTIAIWMGLIAGVVMLAILLFGVIMLLSVKTMDRFDDPKGKTIIVTATD